MGRQFSWTHLAVGIAFLFLVSALDLPLTLSGPFTAIVVLTALTVVHELGHAAASWAVRHRIFELQIGIGPAVRIPVGSAVVVIGLLPLGGHVVSASPDPRGFRAKRFAVTSAGLLMNAILLVVALTAGPSAGTVPHDVVVLSGLLIVSNLVPYSLATPFGPQGTDGLSMLRILASSKHDVVEQLGAYYVAEAQRLSSRGDREAARAVVRQGLALHPRSSALQTWLGHDLVVSGRYEEARRVFLELVEQERREASSTPAHVHALHLNNLAWADLMIGDPSLLPEAEEASRAALEVLPQLAAVKGTRSFALILSGRVRDGLDLSTAAYRKEKDPGNRALQACVTAMGFARDWRFSDAERWLGIARALDPTSQLLDRASHEILARRPPSSLSSNKATTSRRGT